MDGGVGFTHLIVTRSGYSRSTAFIAASGVFQRRGNPGLHKRPSCARRSRPRVIDNACSDGLGSHAVYIRAVATAGFGHGEESSYFTTAPSDRSHRLPLILVHISIRYPCVLFRG